MGYPNKRSSFPDLKNDTAIRKQLENMLKQFAEQHKFAFPTKTWQEHTVKCTIQVLRTHFNQLASLAKWLSVRLQTKWFRFEFSCSHLNFGFRACFEQGLPWHSGNYRVWIHSETRMWHDKNIQSVFMLPLLETKKLVQPQK